MAGLVDREQPNVTTRSAVAIPGAQDAVVGVRDAARCGARGRCRRRAGPSSRRGRGTCPARGGARTTCRSCASRRSRGTAGTARTRRRLAVGHDELERASARPGAPTAGSPAPRVANAPVTALTSISRVSCRVDRRTASRSGSGRARRSRSRCRSTARRRRRASAGDLRRHGDARRRARSPSGRRAGGPRRRATARSPQATEPRVASCVWPTASAIAAQNTPDRQDHQAE